MNKHQRDVENMVMNNASAEERVRYFKSIASAYSTNKELKDLYRIWNDLFKDTHPILWLPGKKEKETSNIGRFMKEKGFASYADLHAWSVKDRAGFWEQVVKKTGIKFQEPYKSVLEVSSSIEDPTWFKDSRLNIADSCFTAPAEKTAIVQGDETGNVHHLSYKELHILCKNIACGLKDAGFKKGDTVILYLPLTFEAVAAYLGIILNGMTAVSVADSFSASELRKRAEMTNARAIFTCDSYQYGGKKINIFNKVKEAGVKNAIIIPLSGDVIDLREGDRLFNEIQKNKPFESVPCEAQEVSNILFSSGTTKEPKSIPWTHLTPIKCASDGYFHHDIQAEDVVTWTTGMGWMMAPWLIYASLINQATMALYVGAAAGESFGKFVNETGVTILGTIPSVVKGWIKQEYISKFRWNVRVFSSTGEPSGKEDYFYLMALANFNAPVIEYCGGTEIGGGYITGTIIQPASPACFTTPALGLDFLLIKEDQSVARENETGEVYLLPPSIGLTQRLLNKDHHEEYYAGVPKGPNGEVLRKHGDAFEKVESFGHVFYKSTGRTDDAMNIGGIKISAVEIEEILNNHHAVLETAAISVPGENQGPEKLVIFYVPKQEIEPDKLKKELQEKLSAELNPLFRIADIISYEALPRTASNKVMRRELRKQFISSK